MKSTRELTTPQDRVAWAIEQVRNNGVTLEMLAEKIGCTHATLSQWQTGATQIENAKSKLLDGFARETGVSMHWILHGGPDRRDSYTTSERVADLTQKLQTLEQRDPESLDIVGRMIIAAAEPPPPPYIKR